MDPKLENNPINTNNPINQSVQPTNHLTVISMALFVLMSLAIVGFLYYQNQQLKSMLASYQTPIVSPTPVATADPTANWERHNFLKMGFSLAVPAKWYTHSETLSNGGGGYASWLSYPVDNPSPQGQEVEGLVANIHLSSSSKPETSLDQDADTLLTQPGHLEPTPQKLESTLGGERSIVLKSSEIIQVISDHNGKRFFLQLGTTDPSLAQVFDQILSTFKFLGPTPTATCKPRPACLDATPRCMIPETSDMCPPSPAPAQKACTQEAKLCPDGSYVGRTGPNCEFAACP